MLAMQRGKDKMQAAKDIVSQTAIPLLGSTAIAILAFGAIGISDGNTGEYCRLLFVVLLISLGQGALLFLLTYSPERTDPSYAQFLVVTEDRTLIDQILPEVQSTLSENFPDAGIVAKRFLLSPGEGARVQVRFSGEDFEPLRGIADQAMAILRADGGTKGIRIDARE